MEQYLRAWAREQPYRTAVECGERRLSYRALDECVDRLAGDLLRRGCRPGDRIGLVIPHGADMVVAMVAALRVQVTYVPIDSFWPVARSASILSDVAPALVVIDGSLDARAKEMSAAPALIWDGRGIGCGPFAPPRPPRPGPAYILFTSGSTGNPKGVVQGRRGLAAHAEAYARSIDLSPGDRVSALASYTFDAAVMDIFGTLAAGATLCVHDPRGRGLAASLPWLARSRVSVCHLTPTLFRAMLARVRRRITLPSLRKVVFGGEPLFARDVALARRLLPERVILINGYGPTECTLAAQQVIARDFPLRSEWVPIGTSIEGVNVSLRGADGETVVGQGTGEIILRSERVALGYWHSDQLRAFGPADGMRTFATGDLAARLPDGALIHLGRVDDQVKINGCRVEPVEVEAHLMAAPGVTQGVVAVQKDRFAARLAAWFVPAREGGPGASEVRRFLQERLPAYMVPSTITAIDEMPVLSTGKIDRQRLLESRETNGFSADAAASKQDLLIHIWSRALDETVLSCSDNFFALGGDSLRALEVQLEAEEALGRPLPSLFTHPTIASVMRHLRRSQARSKRSTQRAPATAPLSPAQRRYWARLVGGGDDGEFNIALIIDIGGRVDKAALTRAFAAVVRQHDALHIGIVMRDGVPVQAAAIDAAPTLRCRSLQRGLTRHQWQRELLRLAKSQAGRRFDLARPGLLRAVLVTRTQRCHALVLSFHHLVMDAWSRLLFEKALFREYGRELAALPSSPQPAHSYLLASAAVASRSYSRPTPRTPIAGPRSRRNDLRGLGEPAMRLPGDDAPGSAANGRSSRLSCRLSRRQWCAILRCARTFGATPFAVIAALFIIALSKWTGERQVVVTTDRANRCTSDREVIGLFADVAVLAVPVRQATSFATVVRAVHRRLSLLQGQGTKSFADLVEQRWPGGLARYDEIFPVAIALERQASWCKRTGGLISRSREVPSASLSRALLLIVKQDDDSLTYDLFYRSARLHRQSVTRLARILLALHRELLRRPTADWRIPRQKTRSDASGRQCGHAVARLPT